MQALLCLLSAAAVSGIKYDGLRVKFGWSASLADMKYFYNIPRTTSEVENEGWRRTERPEGPMPELKMYCPPGRVVCPLYDTAGYISGLQIAIPDDSFDTGLKPNKLFVKWTAPASEGEPSMDYWTATQFYVSPGTHYYYNITKEYQCEFNLPWFAMVSKGELLGVGFQTFGRQPQSKHRHWFEDVPKGLSARVTIPHAPDCYVDMFENYGLLSIHIYYINEPWNIRCESGDSIDQASVLDRLALSGSRYADQIGDEFKKLILG